MFSLFSVTHPETNFANYKVSGGLRRVAMNASEFYQICDEIELADNGSRVYVQVTTGRTLSANIHTFPYWCITPPLFAYLHTYFGKWVYCVKVLYEELKNLNPDPFALATDHKLTFLIRDLDL